MAKVLSRPMFKMGGKVAAKNSGIISGFADGGNVRQGFQKAGMVDLLDQYIQAPEQQRGLTRSDYLRIAAAGANIMGAQPTGRSGFIGALQAASPALADLGTGLAEDFSTRDAAYQKKLSDYNTLRASAAMEEKQIADERDFAISEREATQEFETDLEDVRQENAIDLLIKDKELNPYDFEKQYVTETARDINKQMSVLNPNSKEYKDLKNNLVNNIYGEATRSGIKEKGDLLTSAAFQKALKDEIKFITGDRALGEDKGVDLRKDPKSAYYNMNYSQLKEQVTKELFGAIIEEVYISPGDPKAAFAKGGRVGLANGGGPYEPGSGPDPDPGSPPIMTAARGPYEPGSGPDPDPEGAPVITAQELRQRLPAEVSDQVIQLIASSEQALIDFAKLQTQADIDAFNAKYNTDLEMPSQRA
tara:strand:+ start:39 stop:1292 length:1254 start_codon:yes stop_codon:yes gene_type:complete